LNTERSTAHHRRYPIDALAYTYEQIQWLYA